MQVMFYFDYLAVEPTRNATRTFLEPISTITTTTSTKTSQYKRHRIVYVYPWHVNATKISKITPEVTTSTTDPPTTSMTLKPNTISTTTTATRTPVNVLTTTTTSRISSRMKKIYQYKDLLKYNLHKVTPPLDVTSPTMNTTTMTSISTTTGSKLAYDKMVC